MNLSQKSEYIKSTALLAGFDFCGIAAAKHLDDDAKRLESWIRQGMQGQMHYMEKYFELRVNPYKLVPGAKSVISFLINYFPDADQDKNIPKISKYAYGKDYHTVIRPKLEFVLEEMKSRFGDFHGRGFVDSAPVLEKSWATISGLGWIGKNGNLINKKKGSFFFIATLIVDIELEYDPPHITDYCGTCTRCIDACPTDAIAPGKVVNGSKCISYFTIELKDLLIPDSMKNKFDQWMFGCDICQDVCPWNRFSGPAKESAFTPVAEILHFNERDWEEMTEEEFKKIFKDSPLKRAKYEGIRRNLQFIKKR
jgi:epoxyqueuosine reductase